MFLFYVLSFFKKGDAIQGRTLFKEIRYIEFVILNTCQFHNGLNTDFQNFLTSHFTIQFCTLAKPCIFNLKQYGLCAK